MNKELIQIQQEETEQYIKQLETARDKLNNKQVLCENDFSQEDNKEWINLNNKFIEEKLSFLYTIQEEQEQGINFYEQIKVFEFKPIGTEDFDLLPLTKEEETNLSDRLRLTSQEEDYLENENSERYYTKKYGDEF